MILEARDLKWAAGCTLLLAGAGVAYAVTRAAPPPGLWGGSAAGLTFGILGTTAIVFEWLLSARKKLPTLHVLPVRWWVRAHVWLGLVSLPLILLHGAFRFGGPLTALLMWIFIAVFASGILGVALQQFLPKVMLERVTMETIYEQIPHVLAGLAAEADALVALQCGDLGEAVATPAAPASRDQTAASRRSQFVAAKSRLMPPRPAVVGDPSPAAEHLRQRYLATIRPFLADRRRAAGPLAKERTALDVFQELRVTTPAELHELLDDLEAIVTERRQLALQQKLHLWLHGWLVIHVPLSMAMLALVAVHIVMALRY